MIEKNLNRSVSCLKGVGAARQAALSKIGIETLSDLLLHYPRGYQNRGDTKTLAEIKEILLRGDGDTFSSVLTVACEPSSVMIRRGMTITKVRVFDETGAAEIVYFNQRYVTDVMHTGAEFRFFGKFSVSNSRIQISNPIYEPYVEGKKLDGIVPIYPLTVGLTQKLMSSLVKEALKLCATELVEFLPGDALAELSLPTYSYAMENIHFPCSVEAINTAKKRFVFSELYLMFLSLAIKGEDNRRLSRVKLPDIRVDEFLLTLPFELTGAQLRSVKEILSDMSGKYVMNRILTGDVGSGKTVVAAAAAYAAWKNGYRSVIMAPTEILAIQHYKSFCELFGKFNINCELISGSTKKADRMRIIHGLSEHAEGKDRVDIVIGTHALLSDEIKIDRLGLAVVDEQHKFGVMQRAALFEKSEDVHCLAMTATPIPRTLTLATYGSINVSRIDELPKGRQKIDTFIVNESYRDRLNGFIVKQVEEGHQVYVVCPAVEEQKVSDDPEEVSNISLIESVFDTTIPLKAATSFAEYLQNTLKDIKIGFVHGKQKNKERDAVMGSFASGELDVLVSTTVIEVGVNVPSATLMIVENAERFGLAQLHQLRGRVGRGSAKSYFILVTDSKSEDAMSRLRAIKNTSDGFKIAEYDLEQRGPGDFLGEGGTIRQHGDMNFRLAATCRDVNLIERAAYYGKRTAEDDPRLLRPENTAVSNVLSQFKRSEKKITN